MKTLLVVLFTFISISLKALALSEIQHITDDFFILNSDSPLFRRSISSFGQKENNNCREHIAEILCLVEPPKKGETGPRKCIRENLSESVIALQKIYDVFPPALATIFCRLDTIYVERNFFGTAYAGSDPQSKKAIMGIRESALRGHFSLEKWITWKEQLSFGGSKQGYESRENLGKVRAKIDLPGGANDFLYFVIAHEFGHIYDFANKVNSFNCINSDSTEPCKAESGSWSIFSWDSILPKYESSEKDPWGLLGFIPNSKGSFTHRNQLCFYACPDDHGTPALMGDLYKELQESNLLTTYSATNPWDDFAEATAFWAAISFYSTQYEVVLPSGEVYDLAQKFHSEPHYQPKREWLEKFYSNFTEKFPESFCSSKL